MDKDRAHPPDRRTEPGAGAPLAGLRLAPPPPADRRPDTRVSVALALLGPVDPVVDDAATNALYREGIGMARAEELASDPRYVIGRLHQALTALLADEVPPMDATAVLLGEAIRDAIAYRERECPQCRPDGSCSVCWPHWRKAGEYRALCVDLGIVDALPQPLTAVPGGAADRA